MSTVAVSDVAGGSLPQELEEIFRDYYQLVYRTAYSVTRSDEDAEDVLQSLFLRFVGRGFPADLQKNPKGYLYRAAFNLSLNMVRSRKRHASGGDTESIETPAPATETDFLEEIDKRLHEAIADLPPKAAQILLLRYVHNCSDAEIAKSLGTSRGTIAVSLFRSRARLKKLILETFGDKL
jgi:RNA polymerase sigma-70 factor (ECF subfamily)